MSILIASCSFQPHISSINSFGECAAYVTLSVRSYVEGTRTDRISFNNLDNSNAIHDVFVSVYHQTDIQIR